MKRIICYLILNITFIVAFNLLLTSESYDGAWPLVAG